MARSITVDPAKLEAAAASMDQQAADYKTVYEQLYTEVSSMKAAWDGADNAAFTSQIEGFKDDFQRMYQLMLDYSDYLKKSAAAYRNTQNDVITQAKALVN